MKKIFYLLALFLFLVVSCNSDDDSGSGSVSYDGTYVLTAYNVTPTADANGDGNATTNQMSEIDCFNSNRLSLSEGINAVLIDRTAGIDISGSSPTIVCNAVTTTEGAYTVEGTNLEFAFFGSDGFTDYINYTISGNSLTRVINNGSILTYDASGDAVSISGTIELVYTRQ